jgi:hypothetical protein
MRNYGFDYLVEKTQLLNEMAKFSQFWRTNFPEFEKVMSSVQDKMKEHEKAPDANLLGFRKMEYVTKSLFDFLSKEELAAIGINKNKGFVQSYYDLTVRDLTPEERKGTRKTKGYTPEYAQFAPKWAANTKLQQEFMLLKMVKAYQEKAESEQFAKRLLSDKNLDAYLPANVLKGGSSKFASGMIAKKEKLFGMGMEEAYALFNKAKIILQKLKKSKKLPQGIRQSIYHIDAESVKEKELKQEDTAPLQAAIDTIELIVSKRNSIIKFFNTLAQDKKAKGFIAEEDRESLEKMSDFDRYELPSYEMAELIKTKQVFQQRLDNNQPVRIEKIHGVFEKFGKISNYLKQEFDSILSDYEDIAFDANKVNEIGNVYDMINDRMLNSIVEEGVISQEEADIIKKWASISSKLHSNIETRGEKIAKRMLDNQEKLKIKADAEKKYKEQGEKWEAEKRLKKKGVKKPKNDDEDDVDDLSDSDDDDDSYNYEDEEGVMSYMTEQIRKDSHSNIIGEYKDRGFKKSKNYAYWTC